MRMTILGKMLLVSGCLLVCLPSWGQQRASLANKAASSIDVAVVYNPLMANVTTGSSFWMQGGSVQLHSQFWRGLGVVADVSGLHTGAMNSSNVGLDLVTAVFGPRYTWSPTHRRYSVYGQALVGEANALHSVFPAPGGAVDSSNSMALMLGAGANTTITPHLSVRVLEVNWMRTQMPNNTTNVQNNLRLGAGLVFRFK